jgi:hypothetical protein
MRARFRHPLPERRRYLNLVALLACYAIISQFVLKRFGAFGQAQSDKHWHMVMYYLSLFLNDASKHNLILYSTDRCNNRIRKWSLLEDTVNNGKLLQLIALSCCGQRFIEYIHYEFPSTFFDSTNCSHGRIAFVGYSMVLHSPFDGSCEEAITKKDFMRIDTVSCSGCSEKVTDSIPNVESKSVFNTRQKDNANCFSLAYGPQLRPHRGTDDFDFNDPLYRLNRYNTLFDCTSPVTDPVAFLARLHYKAIRCGRYPAKQTLHSLCTFLSDYIDIDTGRWQDKRVDFGPIWQALETRHQRSILPILDISRHLMDAFPKSGKPLHMHGVVVLDTPNSHCRGLRFTHWIRLLDKLFPNLQFILTLSAEYITQFPNQVLLGHIAFPEKVASSTSRPSQRVSRASRNTVLLIQVDGKLPDLALMKLSTYYKSLGYKIRLARKVELIEGPEQVFASNVFFFRTHHKELWLG